MNDFMMIVSCEVILMENLQACIQGIATSPTTMGVPCNVDLPTVDGCVRGSSHLADRFER